ncbi:DUF4974 domain-containing protein [Pseudoflavitalea sp. X16]|uniref:FecR family protein n=1 Tax=Paraflavitalea devenefica TaxID=2716334 RepID=UPI0014229CDF|nr:FecR family protein [Paraflavitalea devenefica]NII29790.1 DUF4974 domain-containing protein [Paraflavitalea devenefica]
MEKQQPDYQRLFEKLINNQCSPQEVDLIMAWLNEQEQKEVVERQVLEQLSRQYPTGQIDEAVKARLESSLQHILASEKKIAPRAQGRRSFMANAGRFAAAAAVLLLFLAAAWILIARQQGTKKEVTVVPVPQDVRPGQNKAVLTLSDGRKILLDSTTKGQLVLQGSTQVDYKNGQVTYHGIQQPGQSDMVYNTLSTAKGETYSLTLADGSRVWLNAASSVRFPVAFTGRERRVEIAGEAFFKVAKDRARPFIASVNGMDVRALGTEFNINAYPDEPAIKTTLVEGAVKVTTPQRSRILAPGQQSLFTGDGHLEMDKHINIEEVIAWKEGVFHFESADLKAILRQFARWYNVEIIYEGPVKNRKFFGVVNRNNTLKQVLEMLRDNEIIYSIEGRKLIVKAG